MAEESPTSERSAASPPKEQRHADLDDGLRHGTEEHPRPSDHPGDPYGETGAKKVPLDTRAADAAIGSRRPAVRSRTGDFQ